MVLYMTQVSKKYSGYSSAIHGDINMADQEEAVHVSLLEREQLYLSPAHSDNNSPLLPNGRRPTVAVTRNRGGQPLNYGERLSDEVDIVDANQYQHLAISATESTRGLEFEHIDPWLEHDGSSSTHPPPMPPLQPVQRQHHQYQDHTVVQMTDDRLNTRVDRTNYGEGGGRRDYDGDNEDNEPLGRSFTRFTVKRDGKMRYCQKCQKNFIQVLGPVWYLWLIPVRNSIGDGWSFPASEYGKSMLSADSASMAPSNLSHWTPRTSTSQLTLHRTQYQDHHGSGDSNAGEDSSHEAYDVNDASDLDHYRPDSDESDHDDDPQRRRFQPTPRRFRNQQQAGFSLTANSDDEEAEEYLYDSDEPITIHFTDKGR
ncbi:hypothetical protein BGZ80_011670 [Entomortierella chlamydospora]|uniref:Uncharacterized protein n=1 Tax=Entomortierella chlamydospora TaxID=101097 RepID=A0A9P6SYV4_9FUNG|nr:hypothetical protein BGZ79_001437 [Entomortierella chlamydospora]KAG0012539.1 hypothetical protein BGZ80_011670 [Entomortierella chlamydospora]